MIINGLNDSMNELSTLAKSFLNDLHDLLAVANRTRENWLRLGLGHWRSCDELASLSIHWWIYWMSRVSLSWRNVDTRVCPNTWNVSRSVLHTIILALAYFFFFFFFFFAFLISIHLVSSFFFIDFVFNLYSLIFLYL